MISAPATLATISGLQAALDAKAPTANPAFTGALTAAAGVLTDPAPNQITQTWNDALDTFTALNVNVTDQASASDSKLMDLQAGGVSRFFVSRSGSVALGAFSVIPNYGGAGRAAWCSDGLVTPSLFWDFNGGRFHHRKNAVLGWCDTTGNVAELGSDTGLSRHEVGVVEVNTGTLGIIGSIRTKLRLETVAAPASATAEGVVGETRWDAGYLYICTAANTWKRAALATW